MKQVSKKMSGSLRNVTDEKSFEKLFTSGGKISFVPNACSVVKVLSRDNEKVAVGAVKRINSNHLHPPSLQQVSSFQTFLPLLISYIFKKGSQFEKFTPSKFG